MKGKLLTKTINLKNNITYESNLNLSKLRSHSHRVELNLTSAIKLIAVNYQLLNHVCCVVTSRQRTANTIQRIQTDSCQSRIMSVISILMTPPYFRKSREITIRENLTWRNVIIIITCSGFFSENVLLSERRMLAIWQNLRWQDVYGCYGDIYLFNRSVLYLSLYLCVLFLVLFFCLFLMWGIDFFILSCNIFYLDLGSPPLCLKIGRRLFYEGASTCEYFGNGVLSPLIDSFPKLLCCVYIRRITK